MEVDEYPDDFDEIQSKRESSPQFTAAAGTPAGLATSLVTDEFSWHDWGTRPRRDLPVHRERERERERGFMMFQSGWLFVAALLSSRVLRPSHFCASRPRCANVRSRTHILMQPRADAHFINALANRQRHRCKTPLACKHICRQEQHGTTCEHREEKRQANA